MNTQYKRIEIHTEYGETLLLVNYETYGNPYLEVSFMRLTYLGDLFWSDEDSQCYERVLPEFHDEFRGLIRAININKYQIYQNPDKELEIDGYKIKTVGIRNDYKYNQ